MRFLAFVIACGATCTAQTPAAWLGAGGSGPTSGKVLQNAASWACGAQLVQASQRLYSYSCYETRRTRGALTTQVETGGALWLRDLGPLSLYAYGTVGASQSATALQGAYATGVLGLFHLRKGWSLVLASQRETTGATMKLGFGRSF